MCLLALHLTSGWVNPLNYQLRMFERFGIGPRLSPERALKMYPVFPVEAWTFSPHGASEFFYALHTRKDGCNRVTLFRYSSCNQSRCFAVCYSSGLDKVLSHYKLHLPSALQAYVQSLMSAWSRTLLRVSLPGVDDTGLSHGPGVSPTPETQTLDWKWYKPHLD